MDVTVAGGGGVPSRVTVIVYVWVVPSSAVTVKERVLAPRSRSKSAVFGVLASLSPVMATVEWLSFVVAVSLTALIPVGTAAV